MANDWRQTYEQLKRRKQEIDNTSNKKEQTKIDNSYRVSMNKLNNTGYSNVDTKLTSQPFTGSYIQATNPVNSSNKKKWYQEILNTDNIKNLVNTEPLSDGYDFGDVTKTILGTKKNINKATLSTAADVTVGALKGASDIGVSAAKLVSGGVAQVADWVGKDEYAEKVRNRIAGKDEETNKKLENYSPSGLLQKADDKLDKNSYLGETGDEITQGVGYYGGMMALQSVGVPWQVTAGVTSGGNELSEAYANNAKDWEAWLSAGISAGVEIGSEYIFGGVKLPGTGKAVEGTLGKVTEKIQNKGLKYLIEAGINIGGEGLEEVISGFGSAIGQKLTYMDDKQLKELYTSEDALKDFVIGAAVSGVTMGATPGTYQNIKDGRSLMTGKTVEEANTIETETKKRINEAEKEGITLTTKEKNQIETEVTNEVMNNQSNQVVNEETTNEENITNDNTNTVETTVQNQELTNISNQIQELENQLDTSQNAVQQQEILNQIKDLEQQFNAIQQQEQIKENELPMRKANVEEVNNTTTQQEQTNSPVEAESNIQNKTNEANVGAIENLNRIDGYKVQKDVMPYDNVIGHTFEVTTNEGKATLGIRETKDAIYLNNIVTRQGKTPAEKGTGTKILNNLKEYADKTGKKLVIAGEVKNANGFYDKFSWLKQENGEIYNDNGELFDDNSPNRVYDPKENNQSITSNKQKNENINKENTKPEWTKSDEGTTKHLRDLMTKMNEGLKPGDNHYMSEEQIQEVIDSALEMRNKNDELAPIKETIDELKQTIQEVKDIVEEGRVTQKDLEDFYRFQKETASDVAPLENNVEENIVEEYEPEAEVKSPLDDRTMEDVGSRKVKAYQYEHPEVRPFFQKQAQYMLNDLRNSTKGERTFNSQLYYDTNGEQGWNATTRHTTEDIAYLLDNYNYTYDEIRKGLEAIIEDHGAENIAVSKRIELLIDERLRNGYKDVDGYDIPADRDYINMLKEQEWSDYYSSIPLDNVAPVNENIEDNINIPIKENVAEKGSKIQYEAIEPNKEQEPKMIRVKPDRASFEESVLRSAEEVKNELGYNPQNPTKESSYDLTDTSEKAKIAEILTEEPKATKRNQRLWATMKANIFDKGAVFEDVSIKNKNRDLMGKWDYTLTSEARAQNVIGNGHTEYDANTKTTTKTSKSLNEIVAEVENTGLKKEFYDYVYHKHNVDRMNLESKAKAKMIELDQEAVNTKDINLKDKIKEEIKKLSKTTNKPVFGNEVTSDVSQEIVDKYENENPVFMDFAQDVYDYVNADRQQLVKEGVISQETADLWSEMYPHYVPIRRVDSNGNNINVPLDTNRTGVNAPIKKATGGNSNILPLFDTMAMRTLQTYKAVAKNSFGVELKNTLGTTIENQQTNIDEVIDSVDNQEGLLQEGKNGNNPTFTVFENGEKVTYEITQDMYDALKPLSDSSLLSKTFKPFNTASNFHRGLLTEYNPVFMLTNAVKDVQDVLLNSQHALKTYSKIPEAYAQIAQKGYWYQEYVSNGGEQNSYFDSQENTFKTENTGIKKLLDLPPLSTISKLNNFIEMAPRMAEYIASRESGKSVEVSMLDAARVTTNFKAGGNLTKFLNRNGATFLNASVQGAMQQVRNVREANMNGLKGWANLATKFAIAGLPALLLNGLIWDDDEDYEELSDYVKQNYYVVWKNDDGTFIRIPKGRAVAVIQEAIQQIENKVTGNDEVDLNSFLELVLTNLAPNNPIENNIFSPIIQAVNNKTWYGEDLVPTRLQNLPAEEQYDESTDMFSRWLGEKINVSPVKINYLLNQYSGGLGDVVLPTITPKATNDAETVGEYLLAPFKDKFTTNAVMNNKNVGNLYDTSEELTTKAKSSKATDEDVLKNKFINSIKTEMNELYTQKREIQNDTSLSKGEKYEQVLEVQEQINELSKYGLNNYEDINISGNYASVGNRQYKLNSNNEWEKISDKQIEKQEEVSNSLNISASEYWSNKDEYDYAYEKPGKYALATSISDYETYKTYTSDIYDLKADKDSDGKSISGSRKEKVISYVNSLDLSIPQKAMLIRGEYSTFDDYNNEIIEYVSGLDNDYKTKKLLLEELGFKVYDDGTVEW